jgi:hypothetical protein
MLLNLNYKIFVFSLSLVLIAYSCNDGAKKVNSKPERLSTDLVQNNQSLQKDAKQVGQPVIEILKSEYDFGEINEGESATHNYKLKNTGNGDLIISSAKGSCGCTVPEWPKGPIKAGEEAIIKVTFNSKGKPGIQKKRVTLLTNAIPNVKILTIKGSVIPKIKK